MNLDISMDDKISVLGERKRKEKEKKKKRKEKSQKKILQ